MKRSSFVALAIVLISLPAFAQEEDEKTPPPDDASGDWAVAPSMRARSPASASDSTAAPASASAAAPQPEKTAADELIEETAIRETKIRVVPASQAARTPPDGDAPLGVTLPIFTTEHRDRGIVYLDPFLGRVIHPELAVRARTAFAREQLRDPSATPDDRGLSSLLSRVDLNLWAADIRIGASTADDRQAQPMELIFKVPFSAGDHWFAPLVAFHVPLGAGARDTIFEAGLGYHGRAGALGLKLEVSGFRGTHDRMLGANATGMLGFNGVASFLVSEHFGVLLEADGTTVISERRGADANDAELGETVVRLVPGIRIFPKNAAFELGIAGLFTIASDKAEAVRRTGGMLSVGYTFF